MTNFYLQIKQAFNLNIFDTLTILEAVNVFEDNEGIAYIDTISGSLSTGIVPIPTFPMLSDEHGEILVLYWAGVGQIKDPKYRNCDLIGGTMYEDFTLYWFGNCRSANKMRDYMIRAISGTGIAVPERFTTEMQAGLKELNITSGQIKEGLDGWKLVTVSGTAETDMDLRLACQQNNLPVCEDCC